MDNSNKKDQSMTQKKTKSTATQKTEKKKNPKVVKRVSQKLSQKKQVHHKQIKQIELKLDLNKFMKKGLVYIILAVLFLPFIISLISGSIETIGLSQLMSDIKDGRVEKIQVAGNELRSVYKDGVRKTTLKETGQEALTVLDSAGIDLTQVDLLVEDISAGQNDNRNLTLRRSAGEQDPEDQGKE